MKNTKVVGITSIRDVLKIMMKKQKDFIGRLVTGGALFLVAGHSVYDLLAFYYEKTFRDYSSGVE